MGHPLAVNVLETLGAHRTLTQAEVDDNNIFTFDPGGSARNLILPPEADCAGIILFIHNASDDTEILTIQHDTPATVCTPTENESAVVACDGVSWRGLVGAAV
jgi:hypothetical protein